jgi:hypothetical protein
MDNKLTKSLTDLIDETLMELDELRKSRFAPAEIKIEGPGAGIDGKPSNGDLHAKGEDAKDEDKDEDKKDKDMDKGENELAAKGENEEAAKSDKDDKKDDKDEDKKDKKDKDAKGGQEHEAEERKAIGKLADLADMKKSLDASESLMKSYVEERVAPLEAKLSTILDLVNKIADQPVAPRGATARTTPLLKSADEGDSEPLTKAQVASKLFELKKSGTRVDSLDITKAEMGQDLKQIAKKYEIS